MRVTIYNELEAGNVVTIALPTAEVSSFYYRDITLVIEAAPVDLSNLESAEILDSPTLVAWCDHDCEIPGVAMKVPSDVLAMNTTFQGTQEEVESG